MSGLAQRVRRSAVRRPSSDSRSKSHWLADRRYGVVIDAGSSGSRVQVYSWKSRPVQVAARKASGQPLDVLPRVETGVPSGDGWQMKVEPGISSFSTHPEAVGEYLKPLLDHAMKSVPSGQVASTPFFLLATAGMRLVPQSQQHRILQTACGYVRLHYQFKLRDCQQSFRVISGEEEGGFGWVAVNYLMDGFDRHQQGSQLAATYGFLDMGGASTQIAFEPNAVQRSRHADNLTKLALTLLDGTTVTHSVFVTTWLGYGTNQARRRYSSWLLDQHRKTASGGAKASRQVPDPCLPFQLVVASPLAEFEFKGTGDFALCLKSLFPLLNKDSPCPDEPCLFDGKHVPPIDFSVNHFIGISEYWYSTQEVWSMGGVYDFVEFEKKAVEYCKRNWTDIVRDHRSGAHGSTALELSRLESQCFKAAWIINVLHEGIGIPRIVDKGGKGDHLRHQDAGLAKAQEKELTDSPASFQSLNDVGNVSISWTLGMMVLQVSQNLSGLDLKANDSGSRVLLPEHGDGVRGVHVPPVTGFKAKLGGAGSRVDPMAFLAMMVLAFAVWLFCFHSKSVCAIHRRGRLASQGYMMASMEDGEVRGRLSNIGIGLGTSRSPFKTLSLWMNSLWPRPQRRSMCYHRLAQWTTNFKNSLTGRSRSLHTLRSAKVTLPISVYAQEVFSSPHHGEVHVGIPPVSMTTSLLTSGTRVYQSNSRRASVDEEDHVHLPAPSRSTSLTIPGTNHPKTKHERLPGTALRPQSVMSNAADDRPKQRLVHSNSYQMLSSLELKTKLELPSLSKLRGTDHNSLLIPVPHCDGMELGCQKGDDGDCRKVESVGVGLSARRTPSSITTTTDQGSLTSSPSTSQNNLAAFLAPQQGQAPVLTPNGTNNSNHHNHISSSSGNSHSNSKGRHSD